MSEENDEELLTWKIVEHDNPLEPPVQKLVAIKGKELATPMTVEEFRAMTEKVGELITELLEGARKSYTDYCSKRNMGGENFITLADALARENIKEFATREGVTVFLVSKKGGEETYEPGGEPVVEKATQPTKTKTPKPGKRVIAKSSKKNQKAAAKKATKKAPEAPPTLFTPSSKLGRGDFVRAMMFRSMEDAILNLWRREHKEDWSRRNDVCMNNQLLWDTACEDESVPPLDPRWKKGLKAELMSEGWVVVKKEGNRIFARPRLDHPMWMRKQDTKGFWYEKHGA